MCACEDEVLFSSFDPFLPLLLYTSLIYPFICPFAHLFLRYGLLLSLKLMDWLDWLA